LNHWYRYKVRKKGYASDRNEVIGSFDDLEEAVEWVRERGPRDYAIHDYVLQIAIYVR